MKMRCLLLVVLAAFGIQTFAAPPVVRTVPWVASNPLIPHDTYSGKTIRVKGTSSHQNGEPVGTTYTYFWDFGDGSPVASGAVTAKYAIEATHAYSGAPGTIYTATLTVKNNNTGEQASSLYYVKVEAKTQAVEVNVAIDEGLWYLHKNQIRATDGTGHWEGSSYPLNNMRSLTAANVNAFEVNGHREDGDPNNPYAETVARGLKRVFTYLLSVTLNAENLGNPDSNGNGFGLTFKGTDSGATATDHENYQLGQAMDAIIASGTPSAVATTGGAGVIGRTYADIVQDMVDFYAWSQTEYKSPATGPVLGGWDYIRKDSAPPSLSSCCGDNSASQWAAIGLIPAERHWGRTIPSFVKPANLNWIISSRTLSSGVHTGVYGYRDANPIFIGTFATTPSAMVQLALDGVGRGNTLWDKAETYLRNNWDNAGSSHTQNIKNFYYGMFAFTKAMLLHDSNGDGIAEPITMLQTSDPVNPAKPPIDWYASEGTNPLAPDNSDGVARTLITDQLSGGNWTVANWSSEDNAHQTAWAIIMLQRTLFDAGAPVAVPKANPNPAVAGQTIQLNGLDSFHQDPTKLIDSWEWDLDNNGTFETSGPLPTVSFPVVGAYPVKLRVTDNGSPEASAEATLIITIDTPPIAPTANAGGSYSFCPSVPAWFLNGLASTNPDEGQSEPMRPADTIISYEWDLDGDGSFDDATGAQPDVTAFFSAKPPGSYLIQLKVTDNTASSFPSSGFPNLTDTDSAVVHVRSAAAADCDCVSDLEARAKSSKVQLTWTHSGAHHYNIYRSLSSGGPYSKIATTTSTYSSYLDQSVVNGTVYYYVVREADVFDRERCQSNESIGRPRAR